MWNDMLRRLLVRALLTLAVAMVELFNTMDDGPVDYVVVPSTPEA